MSRQMQSEAQRVGEVCIMALGVVTCQPEEPCLAPQLFPSSQESPAAVSAPLAHSDVHAFLQHHYNCQRMLAQNL